MCGISGRIRCDGDLRRRRKIITSAPLVVAGRTPCLFISGLKGLRGIRPGPKGLPLIGSIQGPEGPCSLRNRLSVVVKEGVHAELVISEPPCREGTLYTRANQETCTTVRSFLVNWIAPSSGFRKIS